MSTRPSLIGFYTFFTIGFVLIALAVYYFKDRDTLILHFLTFIFMFAVTFSYLWNSIRIILYGEVLTFNKAKGEFLINDQYKKGLNEIGRIELYHHEGDDEDKTYLDIIYVDKTKYRLDEDSITDNEELVNLGELLGSFLKVPLVERRNN